MTKNDLLVFFTKEDVELVAKHLREGDTISSIERKIQWLKMRCEPRVEGS